MDIDKSHPNSVTVFETSEIENRTTGDNFPANPIPKNTLYLRDREEDSERINLSVALEREIEETSTSYQSSSDEVKTKEEYIKQTKTGFLSFEKEKGILVIYGSKELAGAIIEFLDLPSHREIDASMALENAREKAADIRAVKVLLPGSEYLTKISFQGNSLEDKDIEDYANGDNYELVSFTGKFEIKDDLKLTGRFSNENIVLYIPGDETLLSEMNELIIELL